MALAPGLEKSRNISDFSGFCKRILMLDSAIQSVEVVNKKGRVVEWTQNNCINLPIKKKEIFHMSEVLHESMRQENDDDFGKVNYSYVSREKVTLFSFRIDENILIVISNKHENPDEIARKIVSITYQTISQT